MKHALLSASAGLAVGMAGVLGVLPAQAQTTTYDYFGSITVDGTLDEALELPLQMNGIDLGLDFSNGDIDFNFSEIFNGSFPVPDAAITDGDFTATATDLANLFGLTVTPDIQDTLDAALAFLDPLPTGVGFAFTGEVDIFDSVGADLASYVLSFDIATATLVANVSGAPANVLEPCLTESCSASGDFSALLTLFNTTVASVDVAFNVATAPQSSTDDPTVEDPTVIDSGSGSGDPASVPEPAMVLGLIGLGGWLANTRQRQAKTMA
ncbi:MAG: PEP-CTERM sorting domain-containing protein [Cyanobacteria bacterium P01_A01_bin.123]